MKEQTACTQAGLWVDILIALWPLPSAILGHEEGLSPSLLLLLLVSSLSLTHSALFLLHCPDLSYLVFLLVLSCFLENIIRAHISHVSYSGRQFDSRVYTHTQLSPVS